MYKELVLVKDINQHWICALCYSCTHNTNIEHDDYQVAIDIIKSTYSALQQAEFVLENNEIYAILDSPLTPVNVKEGCK